jgi:hypothetical protein
MSSNDKSNNEETIANDKSKDSMKVVDENEAFKELVELSANEKKKKNTDLLSPKSNKTDDNEDKDDENLVRAKGLTTGQAERDKQKLIDSSIQEIMGEKPKQIMSIAEIIRVSKQIDSCIGKIKENKMVMQNLKDARDKKQPTIEIHGLAVTVTQCALGLKFLDIEHPVRLKLLYLVRWKWFDRIIMIFILINSFTIAASN